MPSPSALPGRPRSAGRLARSPALTAALAARLTARDRWLLRMIHEHRVLTTGQVTQLAFGTTRAATARMTTLYQYRAVDRFRPLAAAGSSPLHFVLDEAGAMLLAAEDGITPPDLGYRRDRAMAHRPVAPPRPRRRGERGLHRAGRRRPRQRRPGRPGVLVVRAALRRRLGRPRPPRRVRPLARPAPRPAGRRHRLLPRVRHRHRAPGPAHRQARRVRRPRRPHRHHHPRAVLAAEPAPRGRAARPARRAAAARHPRRGLRRADPRRPRRDRRPRHQPRQARPGRPGCPPAAPARACGSPSSPRPAPPPRSAASRTRRPAPRPAAWPGIRRLPSRPPGTPCPASPCPGSTAMTSRAARAARPAALLAAAGLTCGGCSLLPHPAASPAPASRPRVPPCAFRRASPRPTASVPPLASLLPFSPARLQAAAALAGRFTAAWDSWSWRQSPAAWLAALQPMAAASLDPALAQAAGDRGVLAQRAAARQTATATVTALAIRDLTPGSVTVTVTAAQVITVQQRHQPVHRQLGGHPHPRRLRLAGVGHRARRRRQL